MRDRFEVDPAALRTAAAALDEHADQVGAISGSLEALADPPVGQGGIGGEVEAAVRRLIELAVRDVGGAARRYYCDVSTILRRAADETERRDGQVSDALARDGIPVDAVDVGLPGSRARFYATDHHRRSTFFDLSPDEIEEVRREFAEIGGDPNVLRFNLGAGTGYIDGERQIRVCGDVFPSGPPDPREPNATMTSRAALAHELGHRHFDVGEGHPDYLPPGSPEDETRASRWAAEHVPGLTDEERRYLLLDARRRHGG